MPPESRHDRTIAGVEAFDAGQGRRDTATGASLVLPGGRWRAILRLDLSPAGDAMKGPVMRDEAHYPSSEMLGRYLGKVKIGDAFTDRSRGLPGHRARVALLHGWRVLALQGRAQEDLRHLPSHWRRACRRLRPLPPAAVRSARHPRPTSAWRTLAAGASSAWPTGS